MIVDKKESPKRPHTLNIENRTKGFITGVIKVISSNETQLLLETTAGGLTILGSALKINKFNADDGVLSFEGAVNSFKYTAAKVPLLKRMFS